MSRDGGQRLYEFLFREEEERSCREIPEEACREVPGNALRNLASGSASKLAERIADPGLTIPWILSSLGVPPSLVALIRPLKDAGSLAPQLFLAAKVRSRPVRKVLWARAAYFQGALLLLLWPILFYIEPLVAGVLTAAVFLLFGVSSGLGSLSFKDTLAKTVPKQKRGSLLGMRATIGGSAALLAGGLLLLLGGRHSGTSRLLALLPAAGALWVVSGVLFGTIREEPGATEGASAPRQLLGEAAEYFRHDRNIRRFVAARSFNLSITLLQPLYTLIAADRLGFSFSGLGALLFASALAALVSGWIWGRLTDHSARLVLTIAPLTGTVVGVLFFLLPVIGGPFSGPLAHGVIFFLHNVAYSGARVGRKTYLVNAADNKNRAVVAAGANTVIGVATLLLSVLVSVTTGLLGAPVTAAALLLLLTVGGTTALTLREV